jgi:WD40 repeat protein
MEVSKTRSSTRKAKRVRREQALPSDVVAHAMGWLGPMEAASAALVCKAFARGCESERLWRDKYLGAFGGGGGGGGGGGAEGRGGGEGHEAKAHLRPPCAESQVVCSDGKSTRWRRRFARRFVIERNWLSPGSDVGPFSSLALVGHTEQVQGVLVWWERGLVFSCSLDCTVRMWSLKTGTCLRVLEGHPHQVRCLAGDSKTNVLVTGSEDGTVRVWSTLNGDCLHVLTGHTAVEAIVLLPNNNIVSGDGYSGEIKVWCAEEGKLLKTLTGGGTETVWDVVSDGKRIVSSDMGGDIRIFDLESGTCSEALFHFHDPYPVYCLALRGDILVAESEAKVRSWDLSVGSGSMREFEDADGGTIVSMCVQEGVEPMRVVTMDLKGEVRLWCVEEARSLSVFQCPRPSLFHGGHLVAADLHRLLYADGKDVKMLDFALNCSQSASSSSSSLSSSPPSLSFPQQ